MAWETCDDGSTVDARTTSCLQPRSVATFTNADNIPLNCLKMSLPACPRIITAMQLLEDDTDSSSESVFCGPPSEPGESGLWEERALEVLGIGRSEEDRSEISRREGGPENGRERAREPKARQGPSREDAPRRRQSLVAPKGDVFGDNQKFICVFQIGLEDDEEFCLVKRILGKAGNNMRRIAEDCSAKVRLRGIGSGFLEGADGREANMPLQLNVSCTDFDSYRAAAERVATLLRDLYKHFRRYMRSKGMDPPELKISLEEVRRDDLNLNLLSQKAQRSPSQRERDRRARERERRQKNEKERERAQETSPDKENADMVADVSTKTQYIAKVTKNWERDAETYNSAHDDDFDDDEDMSRIGAQSLTLPGGLPVPTTPAGRRAAARAGGAFAAAIASAAAREVERQERERTRKDREEQREKNRERKREMERATASRGRNGARGKSSGTVPVGSFPNRPQLAVPSMETGQRPVGAAPEGKGSKERSVPRQEAAEWDGVYDSRGRNSGRRR